MNPNRNGRTFFLLSLQGRPSAVPVFLRAYAGVALEIFAEERRAGKVERIGYLLYSHVRRLQFRFGVYQYDVGDDVENVLPRHLLDGGAQVLEGDAHLVGIELCPPFVGIVFGDELHQLAADFFLAALRMDFHVRAFAVQLVDAVEHTLQDVAVHLRIQRVGAGRDAAQQGEIVLEVGGQCRFDVEHGRPQDGGERVQGRLYDVHFRDALFGEAHEADAHLLVLGIELDDGARQQRHEVALLDFRIHQVDGYGDGAFEAQGEDAGLQPARLLVYVQNVLGHIRPGNDVYREVYMWKIHNGNAIFWCDKDNLFPEIFYLCRHENIG